MLLVIYEKAEGNSFMEQSRCKVFISPPVVVRPGGANHNSFIIGINPLGVYHNDCAL